jgi:hypothetical protein
MKQLPEDPLELAKITRLEKDKWRVTEHFSSSGNDVEKLRRIVQIWYENRSVFESHGIIALENALQNVRRWIERGYVPQVPKKKCLGDHGGAEARSRIARKHASGVAAPDPPRLL